MLERKLQLSELCSFYNHHTWSIIILGQSFYFTDINNNRDNINSDTNNQLLNGILFNST